MHKPFGSIDINSTPHLWLIKPTAQDPSDASQSVTYIPWQLHLSLLGLISLLVAVWFFNSAPSNASVISSKSDAATNSQRLALLTPNYAVDIPGAVGGPTDIQVNNKLALLSPQVGIITGAATLPNVEIDEDGIITYIVQEGDNLSEIAGSFDVSINTIKWENDIGNTIKPGQELRILPVTGVLHTIRKGDTFGKIASMYNVEIEDITIFNDIDATKLIPGKKIMVPNGVKKVSSPSQGSRSSRSRPSEPSAHTIVEGYYLRPTAGRMTSPFGPRRLMSHTYHYGIDFGGGIGAPIYAAAAGTVVRTSCGRGYGKCLIIEHNNGTETLYAHTSKMYVSTGTTVSQGQHIADIGDTGNVTGPHLHFEIIDSKNGQKKNVNFLK